MLTPQLQTKYIKLTKSGSTQYIFSPGSRFVNRLSTCSISSILYTFCGDQITEVYSTNGRTQTINARTSNATSRDTKLRNMTFARWCAFVTICAMCIAGFKSCEIITPRRSRQDGTDDNNENNFKMI